MSGAIDRLIPSRIDSEPREPRLVDVGSEEGEAVIDALSATTARKILVALRDEPRPPSKLAADLDLTPQNVHHHLETLSEAGLIEPIGSRYSEKGVEMSIYGPANDPLLVCSARDEDRSILRDIVAQLFGGAVAVGIVTLAFAALLNRPSLLGADTDAAPEEYDTLAADDADVPAREQVELTADTAATISPEVAFLLGGLAIVVFIVGWWGVKEWRARP